MMGWDYLLALRSRWQLIGLVTLTMLAGIVIWTWTSPRQYTAAATLLFDSSQADPVSNKGTGGGKSAIGTQADIIRSTYVAQRVVRNLKLEQRPDLVESYRQSARTSLPFDEWLGRRLAAPLQVLPTRNTNVLAVNYVSSDPEQAASLATAFAEAYVQTQLQLRIDPARVYSQWFESQIGDARRRLEGAQARLTSFQQARGLIGAGRFDIEQAQLASLSQQLTAAQGDVAQARARAGSNVGQSSNAQQSSVVQGLDGQIATKSAELQQLRQTLGSRHPLVVAAQAELGELNARRSQAVSTAIAAVQTDSAAANARLSTLQQLVGAQRERVLRLSGAQDQMSVLQRDVDSARAAYDAVTNRLNEVRLQSEIPITNVSLLDRAVAPTLPSSPNVSLRLLLGLLSGLLLGLGIAFVLEWFSPHVRSTAGLEAYTGLPVLADLGKRFAVLGSAE
ncbi:GNVR domain-containing protein [Novosphingobium sp. 9U]|uniref:GNVR domain-containing protein n=1 Tax=Novosphingobium sp. 9U TaxID=2653158 RepID=UPI0012F2B9D9|nr:GNVR domain-containing protein [Novosphingobium sp. 9U]VWX53325.1 conserved hypothetical protein [Novosphingobium sp. 9U]